MNIIDRTSDEDFIKIIKESTNFKEVALKLGYAGVARSTKKFIEERIHSLGLSIDHFTSVSPRKLSDRDIFCKNSTVTHKVMRERYFYNNYTPYKCSICGQEPFWNGKPMSLIIDHINGINNDNRLENLRWVCPNCNIQLPTSNRKKSALDKDQNKEQLNYCIDCGVLIAKNSTRCRQCANKNREKAIEELPVTREELKNLIRSTPFTQIGKQFQVSDNCIRKWCKKMSLPFLSSEIKTYSDKDWDKI